MTKTLAFDVSSEGNDRPFTFFLPIAKIDKDKRTVSGYASTPTMDSDGEIVSLKAVKEALPDYMEYGNIREMHKLSAVGTAEEANIDKMGLYLTAKIEDDVAWKKCLSRVYKGFSIGGSKLEKVGNVITKIQMTEISVVDRPANPDCKIQIAKSAKATEGEAGHLLKVKVRRSPEVKALSKIAQAALDLVKAGPPAAADGFSRPAPVKPVKDVEDSAVHVHPNEEISPQDALPREIDKEGGSAGGSSPYGDVKYADPGWQADKKKRYPIDTPEHIRAAWNYIHKAGNAAKYDPKQVSAIKSDIVSAWKDKIGKEGPPKAKKEIKKMWKALKAEGLQKAETVASAPSQLDLSFLTLEPSELNVSTDIDDDGANEDFLNLGDSGSEFVSDDLELPLAKGLNSASSLSYAFGQIRDAQRSLMLEAKREGGDMKDKGLAVRLGAIAKELAGVISQKADHEGGEATDMSDCDDQWVRDSFGKDFNMNNVSNDPVAKALMGLLEKISKPTAKDCIGKAKKNAKDASEAVEDCMKAITKLHKMHKGAYLGKAAAAKPKGKEEDDGFDHAGAMEKLQKAFSAVQKIGGFLKAVDEHMTKAESMVGEDGERVQDGNAFFEVPEGLTLHSQRTMSTTSPGGSGSGSMPVTMPDDGSVYPGKAAQAIMQKYAKDGMVPIEIANLLAEQAASASELESLRRMPVATGGRRPFAFDLTKVMGEGGGNGAGNGQPDTSVLFKGVNANDLASTDEQVHNKASATVIGNLLTNASFGKSIVDPAFRGAAGGGR